MDLFKWMGVGASNQASSTSPNGPKAGGVKPISHADYKQFGLENFGNTCYANSVLQALYFCQPFRELVCDSHDKSNPPIVPTFLVPPTPVPAPSAPSRPPGLKGFRRRDSAIDGAKTAEESPVNGSAAGRPSSLPAMSGPPIPATPPTLFSALRSLFLHIALNPSEKGTVSPTSFINRVKKENELYRSTMHQDAHEFLGFLLNKIVEDLEMEMKKNAEIGGDDLSSSVASSTTSPSQSHSSGSQRNGQPSRTFVHTLFEGTLTSETRCLTCETVSSRDESFLDLSIDIEQNSSVTACLRQFSASEMLSQKNKFFCDSCGGLQEAEKRMKIKKLPNVLALHLKRFKYQEDVQKYIKLSYRVAFPFELRLFNTVDDAPDPDRLYQLFAIVVHIGGGPHHGHYIAIVKARGSWFIFDDDTVEAIREADIAKYFGDSPGGSGYVLFYQAVDLDMASVGIDTAEDTVPETEPTLSDDRDGEPAVPITPGSVSTSSGQLKLDIPTVLEPSMPSAAPTVIPHPASPVVATPSVPVPPAVPPTVSSSNVSTSNSNSTGFFSGVSRTLKHSQSVKLTSSGNKERDKRQVSSSGQGHVDGTANGDAANHVPPLPASPLTHSKSLKGKEKDRWFSSRKKDKKEKRPSTMPSVPVPPLPLTASDTIRSSGPRAHDSEPLPPERKFSVATEDEADTQMASQLTRSSTSGSSVTQSSSFAPTQPSSPPAASLSPPTSFPTKTLSVATSNTNRHIPRPSTSPSSISSPALPLSASHPSDLPPPLPVPVPVLAPVSSIPSPRTRNVSQVLPPPLPTPPSRSQERPSTAGAKPKRKMSLTSMPLAGIFSRRDKDRAPPAIPPRSAARNRDTAVGSPT